MTITRNCSAALTVVLTLLLTAATVLAFGGAAEAGPKAKDKDNGKGKPAACQVNEIDAYAQAATVADNPTTLPFSLDAAAPAPDPTPAGAEFSGVTHNIVTNELWVVSDGLDMIDVYDADTNVRTRRVSIGFSGDFEDISYMFPDRYALIDENGPGTVYVVHEDAGSLVVDYSFETCLDESSTGDGIEGIAAAQWSLDTNAEFFYIVKEGKDADQPLIYEFRRFMDGSGRVDRFGPVDLSGFMADASAIHQVGFNDPALYVLSDDSKYILKLDSFYNAEIQGTFGITNQFAQPEGLTMDLFGNRLYVVGEAAELAVYDVN